VVFSALFSLHVSVRPVLVVVVPFRQVYLNREVLLKLRLQFQVFESNREHKIATRNIHIFVSLELTRNVIYLEILERQSH
jgi:hypothetical protein